MAVMTSDEADVLNGYEEIGGFLRISARQAKHRADIGAIPTFPQGRIVCARKSSILAAFAAAEARGLHKGRGMAEREGEAA